MPEEMASGIEGLLDVNLVGRGGSSSVLSAFDIGLGRPVAVKVLDAVGTSRTQLDDEMQRLAPLSLHPGIVAPYRMGYTPTGAAYVVTDLVPGGSIEDLIARSGPIDWRLCLRYLIPIVDAVAFAHARGVIHQDIKPSNVLVDGDTAKLTDFGVANLRRADGSAATVTLAHAPPEALGGGPDGRDARSDVYCLASTLHKMLTGRAPHHQDGPDSRDAYLTRILTTAVPPLPEGLAPEALRAVVAAGLEKDPDQRIGSAAELLHRLQAIPTETSPPQGPAPSPAATTAPPPPPRAGDATIGPELAAGSRDQVLLPLTLALIVVTAVALVGASLADLRRLPNFSLGFRLLILTGLIEPVSLVAAAGVVAGSRSGRRTWGPTLLAGATANTLVMTVLPVLADWGRWATTTRVAVAPAALTSGAALACALHLAQAARPGAALVSYPAPSDRRPLPLAGLVIGYGAVGLTITVAAIHRYTTVPDVLSAWPRLLLIPFSALVAASVHYLGWPHVPIYVLIRSVVGTLAITAIVLTTDITFAMTGTDLTVPAVVAAWAVLAALALAWTRPVPPRPPTG